MKRVLSRAYGYIYLDVFFVGGDCDFLSSHCQASCDLVFIGHDGRVEHRESTDLLTAKQDIQV